jgi:hypothetical protein
VPHSGLIDEDALGPEASELMRARLHVRSARVRLADGRIHEGISTLFDALLSSFRWYVISPERAATLKVLDGEDLNDERVVCEVLKRSGVIDGSFDFGRICDTEDQILEHGAEGVDHKEIAGQMEAVMETLGVIPFDEDELPPEQGLGRPVVTK